ncbi:HD superfamily phosphohydrolase [Breznakia sp. PF5-3]|uniref:HD domain-containing protein n=1 Tax=unclassified Breznakia TaxID=2623764 RepID=UPI002406A17A|nr:MULTISPECIES: HD domain-containing protein [unclassified Breznakia]MDL2276518.1 HD domain-containing protein [Breznakia sp. OttesenSCG-928-G09]MDF9825801.1 HD superfamily phosphohydrolase [Breznakia sp. PM6-1]MDF9836606.1 HD superfamily phosphohydrolase [Breznakia sp. PF5-3]MDF9838844.1 HD superfamily phosphohydrolase [Breznakia sp. PFB2-8]MDF9860870.1 HD superfamily phosphohydrolase [Breznakia sp. PH5-24]
MLTKTEEPKVMRDVIHGYIHIDLKIIWDLIDTKEFQRLRRIHQLGGDFQVYHTAEHSRFSHSLGVYEVVRRMVSEVKDLRETLDEKEKVYVMIAGLLHDIGHFPFSHAFESICDISHETFSSRIILGNSEIHDVLAKVDENLPEIIAGIIRYTYPNELLNQIVSGQLDADRMDYLLRDAYFTGTSYGAFDLERILRTIRVKDGKLLVKESGIHSVEDYIMARYHMYWQVYYHPVCRSYEIVLQKIFERMRYLYHNDFDKIKHLTMFLPFLDGEPTIYDHFYLDENAALYGISQLTKIDDQIAADLANRLLNRKLFEYEDVHKPEDEQRIQEEVKKSGYDLSYYCIMDTTSQSPYQPYGEKRGHVIWVLGDDKKIAELSTKSVIVQSLVKGDTKKECKIFFPKLI